MSSTKVPLLLFIGTPLLDISVNLEEDVLNRYNLKPDDCIRAKEEHMPLFQELFTTAGAQLTAGGSLQNSARIAKWVLGERGRVVFTGCTGKDTFADWMSQKIREEGVEPIYMELDDEDTGVCACILSQGGQRSMCVRQQAGSKFQTEHLDDPLVNVHVGEADCVFISGYFLAHSPMVVKALTERCSTKQILAITLAAEYICREYSEGMKRALLTVDIVLGNEIEARALVKACGGSPDLTSEEVVQYIANFPRAKSRGQRIVVISHGHNPVIAVKVDPNDQQHNREVLVVPVDTGVKVVDGIGCGDALAGAFLASYTLQGDIDKAIRTGNRAAGRIAGVSGCEPPKEPFRDIESC